MERMKRVVSLLLCLVMVVGLLPMNVFAADETVLDAAIFCSDVHGSASDLSSVMNGVKTSGVNYSSIGFVGDTCLTVANTTSTVTSALGDSDINVMFSYSASHDTENSADIANSWDYSGEVEGVSNYYLVYTIRETDMQTASAASSAAAAFTTWYSGLTEAEKKLPIFIMSHRPLHARRNDNAGAASWYSAISAAAETSDIVFFWAHNHTGETSTDTNAYYVAKDGTETISVQGGSTVTPNFTYMNAGYINANNQQPGRINVATTVQITADSLIFQDYTTSGAYSGTYAHNTTVAREFADASTDSGDAETTEPTTAPTEGEEEGGTTTDTKEVYVLVDSLTNGGEYLIVNTNTVGSGYAMNHNSGTEGAVEVTVQESGDYIYIDLDDSTAVWTATTKSSGFELMNGSYYLEAYGSTSAIEIATTQAYSDRYWSYSGNALGYFGGNGDHYIYYDSGFVSAKNSGSEAVYIYEKQTINVSGGDSGSTDDGEDDTTTGGSTDTTYGEGTYTTADDQSYQKVTFGSSTTEEKTVYVLTDTMTSGEKYLIVDSNSTSGNALINSSNTVGSTTVTINSGSLTIDGTTSAETYIVLDNSSAVWTAGTSGSNSAFKNGSYYLYHKNSKLSLVTSTSNTNWTWDGTNNYLYYSGGGTKYLVYDSGWAISETADNVYLYREETASVTTGSSVTYSVTASDIKHIFDADTTNVEMETIAASVDSAISGGAYAYTVMSGEDIISVNENGTVTFTGKEGTATVKVAYTFTQNDVEYTIWDTITVTASDPYFTVDITHNADGTGTVGTTADYVSVTDTIAIKGVEAGDTYDLWAKVYRNGAEEATTVDASSLTWSTNNSSVISQTDDGNIVFTGNEGTAQVTVYYAYTNGAGVTVQATDIVTFSVTKSTYVIPSDGTEDFPEYPNEGSIRYDKNATAVGNFSETGVAQLELSMTGVPYTTGSEIDVVIMLDMTGSMTTESISAARNSAIAFADQIIKNTDGTFNKNRISVQQFNKNGATELWELSAVTSENYEALKSAINGSTQATGGTPYSTALQECYEILYAAKSDGVGDNRQQFCVFVSDGTPTSVTYITNTTTPTTTETVSFTRNNTTYTQTVPAYSTGSTSSTFESSSNSYHEYWSQLMINNGVTVYGVYTSVAAGSSGSSGGSVNDLETGTICMNKVATDSSKVYVVSDAADTSALTGVFTNIATEIHQAATNVTVEDKIADDYTMIFGIPTGSVDISGKLASQEFYIEFVKYTLDSSNERVDSDGDGETYDDATSVFKLYLSDSNGANVAGGTFSAASDASGTAYAAPVFEQKTIGDKGTKYYWTTDIKYKDKSGVSYTDGNTTYYFVPYGMEQNSDKTAPTGWYNITSGAYAYGTIDETTNLSDDLLIITPYFVYNASKRMLYWTVDKLDTYEYALRYFLYLDNSATEVGKEGEVDPKTYPTNDYAYITYTNFQNNECRRVFPLPQMTWKGAHVSYVFYLVNENGEPVNRAGRVIPFSEAIYVTDVYTQSMTWNDASSYETFDAYKLADELVPDVYKLYDEEAFYEIHVYEANESVADYFIIDGSSSVTSKETTKVFNAKAGTRYDDYGAYSNTSGTYKSQDAEHSSKTYTTTVTSGFDYCNTTVAFAVIWKPELAPDTVVVDYGLDVVIDVITNDNMAASVVGVLNEKPSSSSGEITINSGAYDDAAKAKSANVSINNMKLGTAAVENNNSVRFSLDENNGMQFTDPAVFYYEAGVNYYDDTNELQTTNMYSSVTVIPATTVYYEDDFVDLTVWNLSDDTQLDEQWQTVGTVNSSATQDQDRPGASKISADLDADNNYGYDSAYEECSMYSLGSARKITVDSTKYAEAQFTFYGTGFDVISLTSNTTGSIIVDVYDGTNVTYMDENRVKRVLVDTYYGYTQNEDGEWVVDPSADDALYQVPVMKIEDLPYGQYTVVISAIYSDVLDHQDHGKLDFYLDAIRIYDPAGTQYGTDDSTDGVDNNLIDSTIQSAYEADGERWPQYIELRNNIIEASNYPVTENADGTVTVSGDALSGAIFIDGNDATTSIADYVSYGPNNELYLKPNQSISFALNQTYASIIDDVQIAMKTEDGSNVTYKIYDSKTTNAANAEEQVLKTATDLYYSIKELSTGTIMITNCGTSGILSITNIKVTYTQDPYGTGTSSEDGLMTTSLYMDEEVATMSLMSLRSVAIEEPEVIEPETTEPEETEPETTEPAVFEPETFEVKTNANGRKGVKQGKKINVTVTTSGDVASITVDGMEVTSCKYNRRTGLYTWTAKITAADPDDDGWQVIEVVAYDEAGTASEPNSVTAKIK